MDARGRGYKRILIDEFLKRWENKMAIPLGFLVVTHLLQIPHFIWGGDAIIQSGSVYGVGIEWDIILYSIDLIEIPAIFVVCLSFIAKVRSSAK